MFKKIHFKVAAKSLGKSALWHLSKADTYLAAGALGLGAGLADRSVKTGIQTGVFAAMGMIAFTGMHAVIPREVDKAIENGELSLED